MLKRFVILPLILALTLPLLGCWDYMEINRRAFILGVALDKADEKNEVMVTFQIALPEAFAREGGDGAAFWNITEVANDVAGARNKLKRSINWIPTFEHCQILLIGEELAKEDFKRHMDFFFRAYDVRRRLEIGVVQGKAKDVLEMEFKSDQVPAFFVSQLIQQNAEYAYEVSDYNYIGRLHEQYVDGMDTMISRIIPNTDKIHVTGGGVFRDFKLAGWFSGEEMMSARLLRGDAVSGIVSVDVPDDLGRRVMLRVFDLQTSFIPEFRNDQLIGVSKIRMEGDIESLAITGIPIGNAETIRQLERSIEQYLETVIQQTFQKAQREFQADPFRFGDRVMNYHAKFWREHADQWDDIYQTVELDVNTDVRIRRVGAVDYKP